jgi:hypothetical protein
MMHENGSCTLYSQSFDVDQDPNFDADFYLMRTNFFHFGHFSLS